MMALMVAACWDSRQPPVVGATQQKKITDQQMTSAVDRALLTDSALLNNQIDAKVSEGIVTLSGTADHLMAKERAAKIAQTIRGVRASSIPSSCGSLRSDDEIRKDVESALLYDAATDSYELTPTVKDGVVTLGGKVQSYHEQQLAVHVAKGVKGVKEVNDSITVKTKSERPNSEIAADVQRAIAIDVWLHGNPIVTKVKDGVVTLTGAVAVPRCMAGPSCWRGPPA